LEDPRKFYPYISDKTIEMVNRMTQKDKENRFEFCEEILSMRPAEKKPLSQSDPPAPVPSVEINTKSGFPKFLLVAILLVAGVFSYKSYSQVEPEYPEEPLVEEVVVDTTVIGDYETENDYGTLLKINGGELYYTSAISRDEANKLGEYLKDSFFNGQAVTVQIDKSLSTYQFKFPVNTDYLENQEFLDNCVAFTVELSQNVFNQEDVEIHLCDEYIRSLKIVKSPNN
ncbi:MAG TPA: hypothetical protein PK816_17230, partial [Candidatus Cloacimonadota bacterium]|nr:hypothetical protein [Candidatus Cloacimonadota bacterium]